MLADETRSGCQRGPTAFAAFLHSTLNDDNIVVSER
jgi:hypothetical protein